MLEITVINGPNMASLGRREPEVYGRETLADILARLSAEAEGMGARLTSFQSDVEGEIVRAVGEAADRGGAPGIHPGA